MLQTLSLVTAIGTALSATPEVTIPHERYTLDSNGLEVILARDSRLPIVSVNVWYHVGPANEPKGRTGFAHLFEHLMFQGSKHVGEDGHLRLLESAGASNLNGTTSFDRTNYYETVPANQLELALWLESDRMGFLNLTKETLENQRQVVMNERRQSIENRPYGPSREKLFQTLFPAGHPYHGNVIGSMRDLQAVTLEDAKQFYDHFYAPENATLAVVGDFDPAQAKAWIERYFGSLASRTTPQHTPHPTVPLQEETRVAVREPVKLARVHLAWLSPKALTEADADADFLALILGQGKASRLYRELVYEKELAKDVSASQSSLGLGSVFTVTATARPGVPLGQLEEEIDRLLARAQSQLPSDEEMTRAKNQLLTDMVFGLERVGSKADTLNRYNHYVDDPGWVDDDIARYRAVTAERVRDLANSLLKRESRAVIITVPDTP